MVLLKGITASNCRETPLISRGHRGGSLTAHPKWLWIPQLAKSMAYFPVEISSVDSASCAICDFCFSDVMERGESTQISGIRGGNGWSLPL